MKKCPWGLTQSQSPLFQTYSAVSSPDPFSHSPFSHSDHSLQLSYVLILRLLFHWPKMASLPFFLEEHSICPLKSNSNATSSALTSIVLLLWWRFVPCNTFYLIFFHSQLSVTLPKRTLYIILLYSYHLTQCLLYIWPGAAHSYDSSQSDNRNEWSEPDAWTSGPQKHFLLLQWAMLGVEGSNEGRRIRQCFKETVLYCWNSNINNRYKRCSSWQLTLSLWEWAIREWLGSRSQPTGDSCSSVLPYFALQEHRHSLTRSFFFFQKELSIPVFITVFM